MICFWNNMMNNVLLMSFPLHWGSYCLVVSPESLLQLFAEGLGTYIFIYCLSNIFFPEKKKKWNKIIMKYGNENVSKTARVENTAKKRLSKEPSSYFRESARTKPRPRLVDRDTFFFYFISHRDDVIKIHDEHTLCDMELCLKHHGLVCKVQSVLAEGPSAGAGCEQAGLPAVEEEDKHWVCFD